ncbi:MAG TPA: ABC transporter permease [Xanthobacteraceae bacterium]|nr:ABC transporter permease [Xanthobacteraceae bacterium]
MSVSARGVIGGAAVALFLLAWQIIGANEIVRSDLISYPSEVAQSFIAMSASGELGSNLLVSLQEFIQGFVPAILVGVAAGIAFALSPRLHYLFEPLIVALNTSPIIAFVPIVVVWFGVGTESKAIMVLLAAIIPIVINTMSGILEVHESWTRACRAFGASRWQVIAKAILPGALPSVMVGVRLAVGRAIVGLIAAEMYVSVRGVGRLIQVYSTSERAAEIFVLVTVVAAFGFLMVTLLRWIETRIAPWSLER